MTTNNKIYFVISGVTDGFKKSHILTNNNIGEVLDYLDDRRQICNPAIENFYTIEKTQNYILATIFNPNSEDHVGRKAYISITLFVSKEFFIIGDLISTLDNLMIYYLNKQTSQLSIRFTQEMFEENYINLTTQKNNNPYYFFDKKKGYFLYNDILSIYEIFKNHTINGYQKVFFLNKSNVNVIDQLPNHDKIIEFQNSYTFTIKNYDETKYEIRLNNNTYIPIFVSNSALINVKTGDLLQIKDLFKNIQKQYQISFSDQSVNVNDIFPTQKIVHTPFTKQHSHNSSKPQPENKDRLVNILLLVSSFVLITGMSIFYLKDEGFFDKADEEITTNKITDDTVKNKTLNPTVSNPKSSDSNSTPPEIEKLKAEEARLKKSEEAAAKAAAHKPQGQPTQPQQTTINTNDKNCAVCKNDKAQFESLSKLIEKIDEESAKKIKLDEKIFLLKKVEDNTKKHKK